MSTDAHVDPALAAERDLTLAIDCATGFLALALVGDDGTVHGRFAEDVGRDHAARAVPEVAMLLGSLTGGRERVARVVAGTGPGSYTGLRVALATASGLARAFAAELRGAPTFAALAAGVLRPGEDGIVTLDARRGNVYAAVCRRDRGDAERAPRVEVVGQAVKLPAADAGELEPGTRVVEAREPDAAALAASAQTGPAAAVYL